MGNFRADQFDGDTFKRWFEREVGILHSLGTKWVKGLPLNENRRSDASCGCVRFGAERAGSSVFLYPDQYTFFALSSSGLLVGGRY